MAISSILFLLYMVIIAKELYPLYERFVLDGQKYVGETYTIYYIEYLESVFGVILFMVICLIFSIKNTDYFQSSK